MFESPKFLNVCLAASAWGGGGGVVGGWMELSEEGRGGVGHVVYCVCWCGGGRGGGGFSPAKLPAASPL